MSKGKQALVISFEGPDGVGKSTQVKRTKEALEKNGKKVAIAKLPAYETFTGRFIRRMLNDGRAVRYPNLFQTVQWVDKLIFQRSVLSKLLHDNDFVLLDRWHASMWVYGLASGANEWLTNYYVNSIREPHAVLIFYGSYKRDDSEDTYEADRSFQKSVAFHYILWSCSRPDNTIAINADQSQEVITQEVLNTIYSIC